MGKLYYRETQSAGELMYIFFLIMLSTYEIC